MTRKIWIEKSTATNQCANFRTIDWEAHRNTHTHTQSIWLCENERFNNTMLERWKCECVCMRVREYELSIVDSTMKKKNQNNVTSLLDKYTHYVQTSFACNVYACEIVCICVRAHRFLKFSFISPSLCVSLYLSIFLDVCMCVYVWTTHFVTLMNKGEKCVGNKTI